MDTIRWERLVTAFLIYEIAFVVFVTLLAMLLLRPRGRIEWATVGKEIAFSLIMAGAIYRALTMHLLSPTQAIAIYGLSAILLTIYLVIFLEQWIGPPVRSAWRCCREWWPVTILVVIAAALAAAIALR